MYVVARCHIRLFVHALHHYHHYADVSESIELLNGLSATFCPVCVYSSIYLSCNIWGCVFGLPIVTLMIVRICIPYFIIIIISEMRTICHCLGLGHKTVACVVCLSCFYATSLLSTFNRCFIISIFRWRLVPGLYENRNLVSVETGTCQRTVTFHVGIVPAFCRRILTVMPYNFFTMITSFDL